MSFLIEPSYLNVGSCFEQMLLHVVHEVVEKLDLLFQGRRVLPRRVVVFAALVVDVVNVPEIARPSCQPQTASSNRTSATLVNDQVWSSFTRWDLNLGQE